MGICNISFGTVKDFNALINVGLEDGYCDSTYLGHIEIPVDIEDENYRFFGTHIRELIRVIKSLWKK